MRTSGRDSSVCSAMALSLPPDQQKRMGSDMVMHAIQQIVCERLAQHAALQRRNGDEHRAKVGRSSAAPIQGRRRTLPLVFTGEAVIHADADVAAERGVTDGVLVLLVEEVGGAGVERDATAYGVAASNVEAGVAGIARQAEEEKIAVGAHTAEIAGEGERESAKRGAQSERAGIRRPADQVIAGNFRRIERIGRDENAAVVIR